jgi:drug/metabolite transporter (DMT)-like permease
MRSFFVSIAGIFVIIGSSLISLAMFTIISRTNGLWASIMGYLLIRERLTYIEIMALIIGFLGVFMLISDMDTITSTTTEKHLFVLGICAALGNAVIGGVI